MRSDLPYPPPWMDAPTLCAHICISAGTLDTWVRQGILPPPRERGGKRMWKWLEVDERLDGRPGIVASSPVEEAYNAARKIAERTR